MTRIHVTLALASLGAAAACGTVPHNLEDPSQGFASATLYGTFEHVSGDLEGVRTDTTTGQSVPAGVPYTERQYAAGAELVVFPEEKSALGNDLGMRFAAQISYLGEATVETGTMASDGLGFGMTYSAGGMVSVLRRKGLLVALHGSLDLSLLAPERVGDTRESWLAIYGGARAFVDAGPARLRLGYDLMPFWAGESRLEHRVGALVAKRGASGGQFGLRAALAVGQNRLAAGGLNDTSFTLGVEVGL